MTEFYDPNAPTEEAPLDEAPQPTDEPEPAQAGNVELDPEAEVRP